MKRVSKLITFMFIFSNFINAAQFPWGGWENKEVTVLSVQIDLYNVVMAVLQEPSQAGTQNGVRYYKIGMANDAACKTKIAVLLSAQVNSSTIIIPLNDWSNPTSSDIPGVYNLTRLCSYSK